MAERPQSREVPWTRPRSKSASFQRNQLMPEFSSTRRVRHSAAHMFDLVADVERYPEFVPLCRSLKLRKRIPEPEGVEILVADMTVAYMLVSVTPYSLLTPVR